MDCFLMPSKTNAPHATLISGCEEAHGLTSDSFHAACRELSRDEAFEFDNERGNGLRLSH